MACQLEYFNIPNTLIKKLHKSLRIFYLKNILLFSYIKVFSLRKTLFSLYFLGILKIIIIIISKKRETCSSLSAFLSCDPCDEREEV